MLTQGTLIVFGLIAVALVLFVTEVIPNDMTAVGVLVSLAVLEPYTGVGAATAISGFASSATVTIVAMYILSAGIQNTGIVERLGVYLARVTGGDETRLLGATVGSTGVAAGLINNTPVVAVFIPMITGLADRYGISPSKLLLPLSYAAMLGGTLTLIGTSTNILASDLGASLAGEYPGLHRLSMFEFTKLGVPVFLVGALYLLTVGRRLTPARIAPESDLTDEFGLGDHLSKLAVRSDSSLVGQTPTDALAESDFDVDVVQVTGTDRTTIAAATDRPIEAGDVLTVRGDDEATSAFARAFDLTARRGDVTDDHLTEHETAALVEVVVPEGSRFAGETVAESKLDTQFDTTVLAIRRGDDLVEGSLDDTVLDVGDTLLVQGPDTSVEFLVENGDVVVTHHPEEAAELAEPDADEGEIAPLAPETPVAIAIMAAVVGLAALDVVPIVISALGGVVAMVVTGCLDTTEAYDAVSWKVVFLLAGVLPLGVAMQNTGGDTLIASYLVGAGEVFPPIALLFAFYALTGLLANIITPVASVVLMVPIAVDTAWTVGSNTLAFLLAVMFAASAAFMTPIGYQTNLMVYGPGGYTFGDYLRVGGPLQLLMAITVTVGIAGFWGV